MRAKSRFTRTHRRRTVAGLGTIELLLVLGILALCMGVAAPSLLDMVEALELRQATAHFHRSLLLARSEAIKRNARVVLCKSEDAVFCSSLGGWDQGWIVFQDSNNDGLRQPNESLILQRTKLPSKVHMTGNGNVSRYVSFTATGTTHLVSHAFQAGTLTACLAQKPGIPARLIIINSTGRFRLATDAHAQCL